MPERVEIKIMCEIINKKFKRALLEKFEICSGRYVRHGAPKNYKTFLKRLPLKIDKLNNKGKFLWLSFKETDWIIMITLGLTGHILTELKNHCHFKFITNKGNFYIDDSRNFGTIRFTDDKKLLNKILENKGIDVLNLKLNELRRIISDQNPDSMIGLILLDQSLINGIGNYLRSDILYHAKISPYRKIKDLSSKDIKVLYKSIKYILKKSYEEQKKKGLHNYEFLIYGIKNNTKNKKGHISRRSLIGKRYIYWSHCIQN